MGDDVNKKVDETANLPEDLNKSLTDAMAKADELLNKSKEEDAILKAIRENPDKYADLLEKAKHAEPDGDEGKGFPPKKEMRKKEKFQLDPSDEDTEEDTDGDKIAEDDEKFAKFVDKKGAGKKMKKSFDEEFGEVIDANPILGKVFDVMKSMEAKIDSLMEENEELKVMQKSFGDVALASAKLLKSMQDEVKVIGGKPMPVRGKADVTSPMLKSADGSDVPLAVMKDVMLKSFKEHKISNSAVSRWEMSGYNMNHLLPSERDIITAELKKGGLI